MRWLAGALFVFAACGDESSPRNDVAVDSDDVAVDSDDVAVDSNDVAVDSNDVAVDSDVRPLTVTGPIAAPAADPLAGTGVEGCAVYLALDGDGAGKRRCELFDTATGTFVDDPDPLVRRVYLYDRWYDLYHRPDGVTAERVFVTETPPGTPEETWGARAHFAEWAGVGDGAIWTGSALNAAALRYASTGTEADYQRMVGRVKDLLRLFDVTGIPGYLARHPFLQMAPGAPNSAEHITHFGALGPHDHAFDPATVPDLPAAYSDGIPDADGQLVKGEAYWHGNPSIDQYTGPMVAFPIAWSLLRDDTAGAALKQRMTRHLTCYLKRLRRIEVVHLQSNPDALQAVRDFLAGGELTLDPGDPDFGALDTIVAFALAQPNASNTDTFDRTCPDDLPYAPARVIDAASDTFLADLVNLAVDMRESPSPGPTAIDHMYALTVRGGDASHMMHLAAMSWLMTGDDRYRAFLEDELVARLGADRVTHTLGAFVLPRWCRSYYGDHITFGPHWALITLLGPGPLRDDMVAQLDVELRQKQMADLANAKFELMYATVPEAPGREALQAEALAMLEGFGGTSTSLDEPRRGYALSRADVIAALPEGTIIVCPTADERERCEAGYVVFGVPVPGEEITHPCNGAPAECDMGDGTCAHPMASHGLPPTLRQYADFMWQRDPFALGEHGDGRIQSPGLDLTEPWWLARAYRLTQRGAGIVLAWRSL